MQMEGKLEKKAVVQCNTAVAPRIVAINIATLFFHFNASLAF